MIVYKVVSHDNVERWTREGWKLEQVIAMSRAQTVSCSTPVSKKVPDGCYGDVTTYPRDEVVQVHEPMFLLSHDGEGLSREEVLTAERNAAQTKARVLEEQATGLQQKVAKEQEAHFAYQKRYDDRSLEYHALVEKMRKLEGDLAKVRTAVGTKAFEEALK